MFVYIAVNLPFATFFMSISFKSMPEEIIEAARMDGAGLLRTIRSVVVPMSAGAIATMAVLQFMSMWNELLFAYILLPDETKRLLTPALSRIGDKYLAEQPLVAAGLLIAALVPITLLALSSRFLIRGVSMGAVK
jgi:ABC-type glycerol-3-phosphate transport system permease component